MEKFEFFYGLELGRNLLNMVDNLSRSLQAKYMWASDGQKLVQITLSALQLMRTDNNFKLFWHYYDEQRRSKVEGVSSPVLAWHKIVPKRLEIGDAASEQQSSSVEDHYRAIYFKAIDTVIGTIKNRFDQEGFQMLQKLEAVLFSGDSCNLSEIVQFYASVFRSVDALGMRLTLLRSAMKDEDINLKSIVLYLQSLSSDQ